MKILVTGGTGYIGAHTVVELIAAGHEVTILDNLCNSKRDVVERIFKITGVRPEFFEADLLNYNSLRAIFEHGNFEIVMHFAGLKAVAESCEKPVLYYENNVGGTINLLKAMQEFNVSKLVFSSSATVYGDQGGEDLEILGHLDESLPTGRGISNPYGWTKYTIERMIFDLAAAWPEFSAVILRYFNPVGNHSSGFLGEDPNGRPNNLMPIVMKVYRGEFEKLQIFGDDYPTADGTCVRDYIHVVDLAQGHLAALPMLTKSGVEVFNLGTGHGVSVREIVAAFEKTSGVKLPVEIAKRRAGDLPVLVADVTKAREVLDWEAKLSIEDAMRDTLTFLGGEAN